ncbi:MAG: ABC transporter ATP-binding protein [Xanthobacteraceae bacterium]
MAEAPLLEVENITTRYGLSQVLFGMTLAIAAGEMVTLMGRNGMGKTTTVRSIMGLTPATAGSIRFASREIHELPPYRIAQLGIGLVPEGRQIFPNLTARENLVATAANRSGGEATWTLAKVHELFPRLAERQASMGNQLSGGEQQMLAVGRALVVNPKLLLLDEPLEGLAPIIVSELLRAIARITREEGLSAIIVEQHPQAILAISDRAIVLDHGTVVHADTAAALRSAPELLDRLLGVAR